MAVVITLITTVMVIGAVYQGGLRLRERARLKNAAVALACAQAGLESAAHLASLSTSWRTSRGTGPWIIGQEVGKGTVSVAASDPADDWVEIVLGTPSSSADPVRFIATGTHQGLQRRLQARYVPPPHESVTYVVSSATTVGLQGVDLTGRIRANGAVSHHGGVTLNGHITTVTGSAVSASLVDADTDTIFVADSLSLPDINFAYLRSVAKPLTVPWNRVFANHVLTPDRNHWGSLSPEGIYSINGGGNDIYMVNCYLEACLIVYNTPTFHIRNPWSSYAVPFYHTSPDTTRLPALVVDGDLDIRVERQIINVSHPTLGEIIVSSGLRGLFACTGEFWGPQSYANNPIEMVGAIIAGQVHIQGPGTRIRHDPGLNSAALVEFVQATGLRLIPGSVEEL
jgi:hypothetical protein